MCTVNQIVFGLHQLILQKSYEFNKYPVLIATELLDGLVQMIRQQNDTFYPDFRKINKIAEVFIRKNDHKASLESEK